MERFVRVVVIGGGNMGAGVLYHLAREGWTDCVLIEKAELTSGATWHAAGLVSRMIGAHALGLIHDYAVDFYKRIEAETGQSVSWHNCGSLRVGSTPPLYTVDTSIRPSFHSLRLTAHLRERTDAD